MELDDTFSIKSDANNVTLIELVDGFKLSKDRKERIPAKVEKEFYYGTLYQALKGYLDRSIMQADSIKDARKIATRVINTLDDMEAEIKEKFCVYVKKEK